MRANFVNKKGHLKCDKIDKSDGVDVTSRD